MLYATKKSEMVDDDDENDLKAPSLLNEIIINRFFQTFSLISNAK